MEQGCILMKKKNYKIRITKNKILKESEYDFTGEMKSIVDSFVDSAKMAGQTFRRIFKTSVFGIKTLNLLRKRDLSAMDSLRKEFMIEDERMKQEQDRLIQSQPGVKDLGKFLAMTSPGVLLFEKMFVDPNKREIIDKTKKIFNISDDDNQKSKKNKAAYHNFIMRIAEITNNAKIDLNTEENLDKKILKKASSEIFVITEKPEFKKAIAFLSNFYTKIDYNVEDKLYFEISDDFYKILKMIHDNNNKFKNKIIQTINDKDMSYSLNNVTKALKSGNARARFKYGVDKFNYDGKDLEELSSAMKKAQDASEAKEKQKIKQEEEFKKQNNNESISYTVKIKSNNIILKEEKESADIDFKLDMQKSFNMFYLITLYIYTEKTKILIGRNIIPTNYNNNFIKSLYEKNSINTESQESIKKYRDEIVEASNLLNTLIDYYNKITNEYNSSKGAESGTRLENINLINNDEFNSFINEIDLNSKKIIEEYNNALKMSYKDLVSSSKNESLVSLKNLLLEEEIKDADQEARRKKEASLSLLLETLNSVKEIKGADDKIFETYRNFKKDSDILSSKINADIVNQCKNELSKLNIPEDFYNNFKNISSSLQKNIEKFKDDKKEINNLTRQKQKIESELLKELEESYKIYDQMSMSNSNEKADIEPKDYKYTKTVIKKKENDK